MSKKFIPNGELDFLTVARSFARTIAEEPGRFGVSDGDSAAPSAAAERFGEAYQAARHGSRSQIAKE